MKRTPALFLSGVLTLALTSGVFWLNNQMSTSSLTPDSVQTLASVQAVDQIAPTQTTNPADLAGVYSQREAVLQAQVAQGQTALRTLDKTYQDQIKTLQDQLAQLTPAAQAKTAQLQAVQAQLAQVQAATHQDDVNYRQQIAALQQREAQALAQLQELQGQLQNAYAQIVARQAGQDQTDLSAGQSAESQAFEDVHSYSRHHHEEDEHDD